jgi:hypothetical protein
MKYGTEWRSISTGTVQLKMPSRTCKYIGTALRVAETASLWVNASNKDVTSSSTSSRIDSPEW